MLQIVDGFLDQFRPVIGGDDFNPGGQRGFQLGQFCFHGFNDVEGILAVPHHHDAADNVPFAIEVGYAAAHLRSQCDLRHISQQDRSTGLGCFYHDFAEVFGRGDVTAAAHHEFAPAPLDQPAADFVVAVFDGIGNFHHPEAVGLQFDRVDCDLVLLLKST